MIIYAVKLMIHRIVRKMNKKLYTENIRYLKSVKKGGILDVPKCVIRQPAGNLDLVTREIGQHWSLSNRKGE